MGKGQLSSALKFRCFRIKRKIAIIGIAKRLEELLSWRFGSTIFEQKSETLKVIQQLRNEAHRFGITHHRDKRSKGGFELD
jgi:excinuclease ABC subunit C